MIISVANIHRQKINVMTAHASTLNVFLRMQALSLTSKNGEVIGAIEEVEKKLPRHFSEADEAGGTYMFLVSQTFVSLIAEFETYLVEVMSTVVGKYPKKLGAQSFRFGEILEVRDLADLTRIATEKFLNEIMYRRPSEYRKAIVEVLSADENFLSDVWPEYVERKARRDIGVHNAWRVNETYRRKVEEVGLQPASSDYAVPSNEYFWDTLKLLDDMMTEITTHCAKKFN
jgi:hypothetical protein